MKKLLLALFCLTFLFSHAQENSCLNLLVHQKGVKPKMRANMVTQSDAGFYLYRNCIYNIGHGNGIKKNYQLIDITPTGIIVKQPFLAGKDTALLYADINTLYLTSEKNVEWFVELDLKNYEFKVTEDSSLCYLPSQTKSIYKKDDTLFELVPYLTIGGVQYLYEEDGDVFIYQSDLKKRKKKKQDTSYSTRYGIWFTPNKVERINGIAIGLNTNNFKNNKIGEKDSLHITGINIELNLHNAFTLSNSGGFGPFTDDINYYETKIKPLNELQVDGLNLSFIGTNKPAIIKGLSFGLVSTVVNEQYGITISGLNNFSYFSKGFALAALVNRTTKGKGLQIAAFNRSEEFYGIQIGLWNVIGDKSRPIINWNFKNKKGK
jgi:hypothetical protein